MRTRLLSMMGFLGFLPLFVACSSGGSGASNAAPIARSEYCTTVANDACKRLVPCCNAAGIVTQDATCLAKQLDACESAAKLQEAKGLAYDAQAAGNCLAGSASFHDGCATRQPGFWASRGIAEACSRVFHGRASVGQSCTREDDCAPLENALVGCVRDATTKTSQCVAIPRAARGQPCALHADDASGLVSCELDSICTTSASSGKSTCQGPIDVGQPCDTGDFRSCADGLTCDSSTKTCAAPRTLGQHCGSVPCAEPNVCQYTTSMCVAKIAVGQSCRDSDVCVEGAGCVGGACRMLAVEGTPCVDSSECLARYCQYTASGAGTCGRVYGGAVGGVDTSTCHAIQSSSSTPSSP